MLEEINKRGGKRRGGPLLHPSLPLSLSFTCSNLWLSISYLQDSPR